jgi:hypothetical protein
MHAQQQPFPSFNLIINPTCHPGDATRAALRFPSDYAYTATVPPSTAAYGSLASDSSPLTSPHSSPRGSLTGGSTGDGMAPSGDSSSSSAHSDGARAPSATSERVMTPAPTGQIDTVCAPDDSDGPNRAYGSDWSDGSPRMPPRTPHRLSSASHKGAPALFDADSHAPPPPVPAAILDAGAVTPCARFARLGSVWRRTHRS